MPASIMQRLLDAAGWDAGSTRHQQLQEALDFAGLEIVDRAAEHAQCVRDQAHRDAISPSGGLTSVEAYRLAQHASAQLIAIADEIAMNRKNGFDQRLFEPEATMVEKCLRSATRSPAASVSPSDLATFIYQAGLGARLAKHIAESVLQKFDVRPK